MRVIHLIKGLKLGGMETAVLSLIPPLRELGVEAKLCYLPPEDAAMKARFVDAAVPLHSLHSTGGWERLFGIAADLRRLNADIIHLHQFGFEGLDYVAAKCAQARAIVVHLHIVPTDDWHLNRSKQILHSLLLRSADRVFTCSQAATQYWAALYNLSPASTATVYNGVDTNRFLIAKVPPKQPSPNNCLRACFLGRLAANHKGLDVLLRAIRMVRDNQVEMSLCLGGTGPDEANLRELVKQLSLQSSVAFAGRIENVPGFLNPDEFDLFLHPSRCEGLPFSIIEACAARLPVVATTVGGIPEVIENEITGLLVPPGDTEALARAIMSLANDPQKRRAMGQAGRTVVEDKFNPQKIAQQLVGHYQQVLSAR